MRENLPSTRVWDDVTPELFRDQIRPLNRPAVLRGLIRDWPAVRAAEKYRGQLYSRFFAAAGRHGSWYRDEGRIPQTWIVGGVDHCVSELSSYIDLHGITDLVTWAVPPGLSPAQMNPFLERFAREVVPALRARSSRA